MTCVITQPRNTQRELIQSLVAILSADRVHDDAQTLDRFARTTAVTPRRPLAVVHPDTTDQIQQLVKLAGQSGIALHPISRGCNWGYGDANAPTAGQIILDLSRMNRILEVNERLAYCVIEPGVTQGQLAQYLAEHHPKLAVDVTGAGFGASLVGNTVDRGFGHTRYGDHFLTMCGMDVVLGDGRLLRTGFGHYENAKANRVYRYGVGPFLDGLFAQSGMGIVTRLGLWLMLKPEAFAAFFFKADDDQAISDLTERLAPLRMQGILQSALHIANDLRVLSARMTYPWDAAGGNTPLDMPTRRKLRKQYDVGAWNGLGAIYGTPEIVAATRKAIAKALGSHRAIFLNDGRIRLAKRIANWLKPLGMGHGLREKLAIVEPVYGLLQGKPTDEPLHGVGWRLHQTAQGSLNPLDRNAGLIWASPILPMTGTDAQSLLEIMEPIYQHHGFDPLLTFTLINERSMVCVSNIAYDRSDEAECEQARACYEELMAALMTSGYIPYRTGPDGFGKLANHSHVFWDVVHQLKSCLDPMHTISPGRYDPVFVAEHQR